MTPKQIEIGDKLLKLLEEGPSTMDQYPEILKTQGYDYRNDVGPTVDWLADRGLVHSYNYAHNIKLTEEGYTAAKLGLEKYYKQKDYAADIDLKSKETGIISSRWSLIFSGVAVVVSIAAFFKDCSSSGTATISTEKRTEGNNNSDSSESHIENSEPKVLISELIPEFANSLKHDSVFVRELAEEIKKQK